MTVLSKKDILEANDIKTVLVPVPEWNGEVKIATISGDARDNFEALIANKNTKNLRAKLVAMCVVDDNGNLMFTEADIVKLGKKSCIALDRVVEAAQKLSALGDSEVENKAKN